MKILFLTPLPLDCASTRQRVHKYIPMLEKEGIECKVCPAFSRRFYRYFYNGSKSKSFLYKFMSVFYEISNRIRHIFLSFRFDIVFVQKVLTSTSLRWMDRLFFLFNKKVIYDFDDSVYMGPSSQLPGILHFLQDYEQVNKIIKKSKVVIAGNNFLKEYAARFNNSVVMIPTPMDTDMYQVKQYPENTKEVTIGWSGSKATNFYVNYLLFVLNALGRKYDYIKFIIISNSTSNIKLEEFKDIKVEFYPWKLENLIKDLHKIDIGVMPLIYNEWNLGKCGGKILQYMACGIPLVCSPVGANKDIVSEGINGFFADTDREWIGKLSCLIENAELRTKIGKEGRRTVEETYSNVVNAPKLKNIFKDLYCGKI